jgi:hypothetical protein
MAAARPGTVLGAARRRDRDDDGDGARAAKERRRTRMSQDPMTQAAPPARQAAARRAW